MKAFEEFIKIRDEIVEKLLEKYKDDPEFRKSIDAIKKNKKRKDEKKE